MQHLARLWFWSAARRPLLPLNAGPVPAASLGRGGRAQNQLFPSSARRRTLGAMTQLTGLAGDGSAEDSSAAAAVLGVGRELVRSGLPGASGSLPSGPGPPAALGQALGADT